MMFSLPFMLSFMMMIRLFHLCGQSIMMILRHFTSIFWKTESCTAAIMVFFHVLNFRLRMPTLYPVFRGYPLSILLYILMIINLIFFPSVEAGKFYEKNGKIYLSLSITCHHATTDGWHVKCFLESFEQLINTFEYK